MTARVIGASASLLIAAAAGFTQSRTMTEGPHRMEVMLDRRLEERRQRRVPSAGDKRRADRRVRDVSKDLQTHGWALVHR